MQGGASYRFSGCRRVGCTDLIEGILRRLDASGRGFDHVRYQGEALARFDAVRCGGQRLQDLGRAAQRRLGVVEVVDGFDLFHLWLPFDNAVRICRGSFLR